MKSLMCLIAGLLIVGSPVGAQEQPADASTPAPIYEESADATQQIAEALARAKKENRRVLIQWGANWCGWCHLLHRTMSDNAEVRRKLLYEYDVVLVDIGQWDKNLDLVEKYGADIKGKGVPYLTILDAEGKVIANQETGSLEAKVDGEAGHDASKVLAFLTEHQAPYLSAESVLEEGLAKAKKEDKRVFLHFGAPWCGWCHRLEAWMAREDVAPVLAKDFVDVKIDVDRTVGGEKLLAAHRKGESGGIPWFVFLEPTGEAVVDSNGPNGNLGCPWTDEEMAAFKPILRKAARHLSDEQIDGLIESLRKQKEKSEQKSG